MEDYEFGKRWVEAEKEAALTKQQVLKAIMRYNDEDEIIESDRCLHEANMILLNNISTEIRALRLFMVMAWEEQRDENR
jgi:hypothetical protein